MRVTQFISMQCSDMKYSAHNRGKVVKYVFSSQMYTPFDRSVLMVGCIAIESKGPDFFSTDFLVLVAVLRICIDLSLTCKL